MLVLVPAYGRDYKSKKAVLEDWKLGRDFIIAGGPYINNADATDKSQFAVRYNKLTKVCIIKKNKEGEWV